MKNLVEHGTLFPTDLPEREWVEFKAEGFSQPAIGVIHRRSYPALCGMPLGGIDTGCLDLETSGLFGLCSIFNSLVPRRGALNLPFLGLSVGGRTWVLTTGQQSPEKGCGTCAITMMGLGWAGATSGIAANEPRPLDLELPGVQLAKDIHYWGHYPVADLEFETEAPVGVGLRAWTPFLPGDVDRSILPGAIFEVHLRNISETPQSGTLAFSFFGPTYAEAWRNRFGREEIESPVRGVHVTSPRSSYVLGVIGTVPYGSVRCDDVVRTGGELGRDGEAWAQIEERLPPPEESRSGASVAVDFALDSGAEKVVRFVLTWYSPHWMSTGNPAMGPRAFRHMYSTRYPSAVAAARVLVEEHEVLLGRVLTWQEEVYADQTLPDWLREALVNTLHVYTEVGVWAAAEPPIGEWCRPEDGLFSTNESPRHCPQMETICCSFWGNPPIAYFFPRLALSTLRGQKAYQCDNGAPPWLFGGLGAWTGGFEIASPTLGYQVATNTPWYVSMVDNYWQLHGDDVFLEEFYPSVKRSIEFMVDLNRGPDGVVSMPDRMVSIWGLGQSQMPETEIYECCYWTGIAPHVGGLHLAALRIAERMARAVGDEGFARQCEEWIQAGSESLESKTWADGYYLRYSDPTTGESAADIFAVQLDGEWLARQHGVKGVFRPDRVMTTLETIKRTCVTATHLGALNQTTPGGAPVAAKAAPGTSGYPSSEAFTITPIHLGLSYLYAGQVEFGLEVIRRMMHNYSCQQGFTWYGVASYDGFTGKFKVGAEYVFTAFLWAVVGAMEGKDVTAPAERGGLVDRIIRAAVGSDNSYRSG